ncbi:hypothetical protein L1999_13900 [Neobacillus drentensis]|nr:hypothetical protein [Neobacillus drentensis]ULT59543.1 hypothetical protein L1999_13900 [Neobacillus drentensis]
MNLIPIFLRELERLKNDYSKCGIPQVKETIQSDIKLLIEACEVLGEEEN